MRSRLTLQKGITRMLHTKGSQFYISFVYGFNPCPVSDAVPTFLGLSRWPVFRRDYVSKVSACSSHFPLCVVRFVPQSPFAKHVGKCGVGWHGSLSAGTTAGECGISSFTAVDPQVREYVHGHTRGTRECMWDNGQQGQVTECKWETFIIWNGQPHLASRRPAHSRLSTFLTLIYPR